MQSAVSLDPPSGAQFLQELGFLLTPDGDGEQSPAYLMVALRGKPTLRHFDPERVVYWVTTRGRGTTDEFLRSTHVPLDRPFSWGTISVIDRLDVSNEYLAFGGRLSAAHIDGFTVAVFASPAPMLRTTGHSQMADPGANPLSAFFARLRAAAGESRDLEHRLADASPVARYAAYIMEAFETYRHSPLLRSMHPGTWLSLGRQESRLRETQPVEWAQARDLLSFLTVPPSDGLEPFARAPITVKEASDARS